MENVIRDGYVVSQEIAIHITSVDQVERDAYAMPETAPDVLVAGMEFHVALKGYIGVTRTIYAKSTRKVLTFVEKVILNAIMTDVGATVNARVRSMIASKHMADICSTGESLTTVRVWARRISIPEELIHQLITRVHCKDTGTGS